MRRSLPPASQVASYFILSRNICRVNFSVDMSEGIRMVRGNELIWARNSTGMCHPTIPLSKSLSTIFGGGILGILRLLPPPLRLPGRPPPPRLPGRDSFMVLGREPVLLSTVLSALLPPASRPVRLPMPNSMPRESISNSLSFVCASPSAVSARVESGASPPANPPAKKPASPPSPPAKSRESTMRSMSSENLVCRWFSWDIIAKSASTSSSSSKTSFCRFVPSTSIIAGTKASI